MAQLILKSKSMAALGLQWLWLRGPYGEAAVRARIAHHTFSEDAADAPPLPLPLHDAADTNRLLSNKAIHFRCASSPGRVLRDRPRGDLATRCLQADNVPGVQVMSAERPPPPRLAPPRIRSLPKIDAAPSAHLALLLRPISKRHNLKFVVGRTI